MTGRPVCPVTRHICMRITNDCSRTVCYMSEAGAILRAMKDVPIERRMDVVATAVDVFIRTGGEIGDAPVQRTPVRPAPKPALPAIGGWVPKLRPAGKAGKR